MLKFVGIGAQKAGTTWLHSNLSAHPDIAFPEGKEVHFWDSRRDLGIEWYKERFSGSAIEGDITPAYAVLDPATIREVASHYPSIRIIYLIRNPIDRAWSSAMMALRRAEMSFDEASDQWFIDHFRSAASLARGDYEACIQNWLSAYPPDQILIRQFEEISSRPRQLLQEIANFVGAEPAFFDDYCEKIMCRKIFAGNNPELRPILRDVLVGIYDRKIDSLANYLGIDLRSWKTA